MDRMCTYPCTFVLNDRGMDDPNTTTPPNKEIHLPWESINPEESDPGLPLRRSRERRNDAKG